MRPLSFLILPLGRLFGGRWIKRMEPEHLDRGLVLILPGIEGRSFLNLSIMSGLLDAGLPYAMEIVDWTTGRILLLIYHLRAWRRNQLVARQIAARVVEYRRQYPGRPVWLVGHSGGGAMALLAAEFLPAEVFTELDRAARTRDVIRLLLRCRGSSGQDARRSGTSIPKATMWFSRTRNAIVFGTVDGVHAAKVPGCIGIAAARGSESRGRHADCRQVFPIAWQ